VEGLVMDSEFWNGKRVLITGHTGFKGAWLSLWLQKLGARVVGYALAPPTTPSLFEVAGVGPGLEASYESDVRDLGRLEQVMATHEPEIVVHMAAQPLVRYSYTEPVETYSTNVMGTVNVLEAVRQAGGVRVVVNVTSDKCYENREWVWGYRESEPMGGYDPYSNSKGCAELVTSAYRASFFNPADYASHGVALASVRAGNVIGGGDWAEDRLIPDVMRALMAGEPVRIRRPDAIRPWQHVLEPLRGYLMLAERLWADGPRFAEGWNFGPADEDARTVGWIVERLVDLWGESASYEVDKGPHPHEATYLKLDCSKVRTRLGWVPAWDLSGALESIVDWYRAYAGGSDMRTKILEQIDIYTDAVAAN
jgi:CDP-glucose 4,6-dehydratase